MLQISPTNAYKRDFKKIATALVGSSEYVEVMYCLIHQLPLAEKYKDHPLHGEWQGFRDCHIKPDLVLIYAVENNLLRLVRLGSHSELFG
ncbi:type II toxin-antitoxin system YafQ family toxin [Mannheimia pernigra]|uniref:type II toxin-antitoxin system RelE/ParE family toxin n=1 Tax=Mannheimia pernigra TaxID=111844 RepID=UPI00159F3AC4|nr:type II toxin-antitoxin system YafQ family toxin [Mannheimia pernigra]QLB44795.1 type II toxin-antitoxin system YafQ family toxin [Mannheimia pernigra]